MHSMNTLSALHSASNTATNTATHTLQNPSPPEPNIVQHERYNTTCSSSTLHLLSARLIKPILSRFPVRTHEGQLCRRALRSSMQLAPLLLRTPANVSVTSEQVTDANGSPYPFRNAHGQLNQVLRGEWVRSTHTDNPASDLVIYFPGGAFLACGPETHRMLTGQLANDADLFVVKYRKLPDNDFSDLLEDAQRVYDFVLRKGYTPDRIYLAGDSAGGFMALHLCHQLLQQQSRAPSSSSLAPEDSTSASSTPPDQSTEPSTELSVPKSKLKGIIAISPLCDLTATEGTAAEGGNNDRILPTQQYHALRDLIGSNHHLANLSPINFDYRDFPPLLITAGSNEMLLDQIRDLSHRAASAGASVDLHLWEDEDHAFPVFSPYAGREAVGVIRAFSHRLGSG